MCVDSQSSKHGAGYSSCASGEERGEREKKKTGKRGGGKVTQRFWPARGSEKKTI